MVSLWRKHTSLTVSLTCSVPHFSALARQHGDKEIDHGRLSTSHLNLACNISALPVAEREMPQLPPEEQVPPIPRVSARVGPQIIQAEREDLLGASYINRFLDCYLCFRALSSDGDPAEGDKLRT